LLQEKYPSKQREKAESQSKFQRRKIRKLHLSNIRSRKKLLRLIYPRN